MTEKQTPQTFPLLERMWKGEGKEKGDRVGGEKVKSEASGAEEQLRQNVEDEKEGGAGAFLIHFLPIC